MITPQQAVKAAVDYFANVTAGTFKADPALAVDSIELSKDAKFVIVTLSHNDPSASTMVALYPGSDTRVKKEFKIDASDASVIYMKTKEK
jgi:hypothetical protein